MIRFATFQALMMAASIPNGTMVDVQCLNRLSANMDAYIAHEIEIEIEETCLPKPNCESQKCERNCATKLRAPLTSSGYRPIHFAAGFGNDEVTETLVDLGASMDSVNDYGSTALHIAAYEGHSSVVKLLITSGANVNSQDVWLQTPLHDAVQATRTSTNVTSTVAIINMLIENGADANARDGNQTTPLHLAIKSGIQARVETLISKGSDIDAQDDNGSTPLHIAAKISDCEMYNLLVTEGADESIEDSNGMTPKFLGDCGD